MRLRRRDVRETRLPRPNTDVIPAKAGIHGLKDSLAGFWTPAFAGVTALGGVSCSYARVSRR
jgi:hypothetical protein